MKTVSMYNLTTGEIRAVYHLPSQEDVELNVMEGEGYVEGDYPANEWYVADGTPTQRPEPGILIPEPPYLAGQLLRFDNVPAGTRFICPQGEFVIDDGFVEWGALEPGIYRLGFLNFPLQEVWIYADVTAV